MQWQKLGHIDIPHIANSWMHSHAFLPTPIALDETTIRVFVAFLDADKIGRLAYVDVSANNPQDIIAVSEQAIMDVGDAGCFDDSGVNPSCIVPYQNKLYMYYVGWQRGVNIRYTLFVGLAVSHDHGLSFQRVSQVPVLDRVSSERFVRTAAHVHFENDRWRMWYIGGDQWISHQGKQVPSYGLRYLESEDGIDWSGESIECMNPQGMDEYGFGRPWIKIKNGQYHMLYSIRSHSMGYRLGYAISNDGIDWQRQDDQVGIDVSESGWDSDMQCFAHPITVNGHTYIFYNGNNYGETGMGVARLIGGEI
jgi:hypothetical protein